VIAVTSVDVAVIGRGLIGSAAARHLAESGISTAVIGPDEPADRRTSTGPFSSHADEGRITRIAAANTTWASLAIRSIRRYADIARRAELPFHAPRGLVVVRPDLDAWIDSGLITGSNIRTVDADWLRATTGIAVTNGLPVAYEGSPAGYIQPRRLVVAQTTLARAAGATVIDQAATAAIPIAGGYEISGPWGSIRADRLLVATGAFGRQLLDHELKLVRRPETVVLAEMVELSALPSLILAQPPDERLAAVHWVPPVAYPDGRICLKIGGNLTAGKRIGSDEELVEWFQGDGDPVEAEALTNSLQRLLPGVPLASVTAAPCVITETATGFPYIGWLDDGLAVAIGGNGEAAKSSDEIGRLAASLFTADGWTDSLSAEMFAPQMA
jgi:sarcosine oxidase